MEPVQKKFGRFYTPSDVADALISMVDISPRTVVDLGCGHGSLSKAALRRWGDVIQLTTVDIDPQVCIGSTAWSRNHRHVQCDLLDAAAPRLQLGRTRFDLAILNPPYGRCRAGTAAASASKPNTTPRCRATLFLLRAFEAVRHGGRVAAIIPETLAIGMASGANRRAISSGAIVEAIAVLPAKTFPGTEARTVMVIFRRIPKCDGNPRPWWDVDRSLPSSELSLDFQTTIGDLGVKVVRGRLNTIEARNAGAFHLDAFRSARDGVIAFPRQSFDEADRAAAPGDILVARVGRNIPDKVVRVSEGSNVISDCVYRLRCPPLVAERVWKGLRSEAGRRQMTASLSGLTTRMLPLKNLLTLSV